MYRRHRHPSRLGCRRSGGSLSKEAARIEIATRDDADAVRVRGKDDRRPVAAMLQGTLRSPLAVDDKEVGGSARWHPKDMGGN